MPSLTDALAADLSGYAPVENTSGPGKAPRPEVSLQPVLSSMIRCPLPPVNATPDSLRSFYVGGLIPQHRLMIPMVSSPTNGGGTVIENTTVTSSTSSSSGSGSSTNNITSVRATFVTPSLAPGDSYQGVINMSRTFQLLSVSANVACRIQLYGTSTSQSTDSSRGIDVPPGAGVFQNIITDVVLDTSPYQWSYQNRGGANADSPSAPVAYITVTNLDTLATAVTVVVEYTALES